MNYKNVLKHNAIWLVFILEVIVFAIASGGAFIRTGNIVNISRQVAYYGIASVGMTFVILIAGIDLSIGSIITLVNVVCAFLMFVYMHAPPTPAPSPTTIDATMIIATTLFFMVFSPLLYVKGLVNDFLLFCFSPYIY